MTTYGEVVAEVIGMSFRNALCDVGEVVGNLVDEAQGGDVGKVVGQLSCVGC